MSTSQVNWCREGHDADHQDVVSLAEKVSAKCAQESVPADEGQGAADDHDCFFPQNKYWPIVHMNEFWLMKNKMMPINDTLSELPLKLTFTCVSPSEKLATDLPPVHQQVPWCMLPLDTPSELSLKL